MPQSTIQRRTGTAVRFEYRPDADQYRGRSRSRSITVDHVTVCRWVQRFTPELIEAARPGRPAPGARWFAGETDLKVAGKGTYLYRAVDQHGQVIDILLSARRDRAAARHFFTRALRAGTIPVEVTTDRAHVYPRVLDELIPTALHTRPAVPPPAAGLPARNAARWGQAGTDDTPAQPRAAPSSWALCPCR